MARVLEVRTSVGRRMSVLLDQMSARRCRWCARKRSSSEGEDGGGDGGGEEDHGGHRMVTGEKSAGMRGRYAMR